MLILALQPLHVTSVRWSRRQSRDLSVTTRLITRSNLSYQSGGRPAITYQMMASPNHLVQIFRKPENRKAKQRGFGQIQSLLFVGLNVSFNALLLFMFGAQSNVFKFDGDLDSAVHGLVGLRYVLPDETGPQDGMSLHYILPGHLKCRN